MKIRIRVFGNVAEFNDIDYQWKSSDSDTAKYLNSVYDPEKLREPGGYHPDIHAEIVRRLSNRPNVEILEFTPAPQQEGLVY